MITNSLEWEDKRQELKTQILSLRYDPALRTMLKNIDTMVTELNKAEVDARRTRVTHYLTPHLDKINESITLLEKVILLGMMLD